MSFATPGLLSEAQMRQQQNRDDLGQYARKRQGAPGASARLAPTEHGGPLDPTQEADARGENCLGDEPCDEGVDLCATHAAERANAAAARIGSARSGVEASLARHQWEDAMAAYAATPFGEAAVRQMRTDLHARARTEGWALGESLSPEDAAKQAVLDRVLARGRAIAAARHEALAVDALAGLPVPGAPKPVHTTLADDENGHPLDERSRAWFTRQIQTHQDLAAEAEADGIDGSHFTSGNSEHERHGRAVFLVRHVSAADAVVASARASDRDLAEAARTFTKMTSGLSVDPLDVEAVEAREAVQAQLRRILDHPNAGLGTFTQALGARRALPPQEVLAHPACPSDVLATASVDMWHADPLDLDAATWERLRDQAATSPGHALFVTRHHPQASAAAEAESRLAGVRWTEMSDKEMSAVAEHLFRGSHGKRTENTDRVARFAAEALLRDTAEAHYGPQFDRLARFGEQARQVINQTQDNETVATDGPDGTVLGERRKAPRRRIFG